MSTAQGFVEHLQSQSGLGSELSFKKMFGEYALYFQGKVVAFACDNQLYLKPTEEGRAVLGRVVERPPYPGAKLYFLIDEQLEDRELLGRLLQVTAQALPLPKPKATPKAKSKSKAKA
jgi:TfoX/Sxy family transcriptional regulator of competence genes